MTEGLKRSRPLSPVEASRPEVPVLYVPDATALSLYEAIMAWSPALQAGEGGLDFDYSQDLPHVDAVPKYSYSKRSTARCSDSPQHADATANHSDSESRRIAETLENASVLAREALVCDAAMDPVRETSCLKEAPPAKKRKKADKFTAAMVNTAMFHDYVPAERGYGVRPEDGWTRGAGTDYVLPGEEHRCIYPKATVLQNLSTEGHQQPALTKEEKNLIDTMVGAMKKTWPCITVDRDKALEKRYAFVNGFTLFKAFAEDFLIGKASDAACNKRKKWTMKDDATTPPAKRFLDKLKYKDPDNSLKEAMCNSALNRLEKFFAMEKVGSRRGRRTGDIEPGEIGEQVKNDDDLRGVLLAVHHSGVIRESLLAVGDVGKEAKRVAAWIRVVAVPEGETNHLMKKLVAETPGILEAGLKSGAFKPEDVILVDSSWNRIERPDVDDKRLRAIYIWEAKDANDHEPCMDKVVGGCIYNADVLSDLTTEFQLNRDKEVHQTIIETLQNQISVQRGVHDSEGMVKLPLGNHCMNGQLQTSALASSMPKSILEHRSFRSEYAKRRDVSQLWAFKLLATFMPHFAAKQLEFCRKNGLLNSFGTPDYACFGSWGYYSATHKDADYGATHADVTERGAEVLPDSSNFYYAKYKLILELAHKTRWFWDACEGAHGTTLSYPSVVYPHQWKTFVRTPHLRAMGQVSCAFMTTKSQHSAAMRRIG